MSEEKLYILKYWIWKKKFNNKEELLAYLESSLKKKTIDNLKHQVQSKEEYLIFDIKGNKKNIDTCYDKLKFNRNWSFRIQDELGNYLRSKSYRILAELELSFRKFINRAMIEVGGFNWWDLFIPENIKENVAEVQRKATDKQLENQHELEFTKFNDLLNIITANFQDLSDDEHISIDKLSEIISNCENFQDFKKELNERREIISIWENVFSKYFEDKQEWSKLERKIQTNVISTRNKVMHHRMLRVHEVRKLKECSDEVQKTIELAKTGLNSKELQEAQENLKLIGQSFRKTLKEVYSLQALDQLNEQNKIIAKSLSQAFQLPDVSQAFQIPNLSRAFQTPNIANLINSRSRLSNIKKPSSPSNSSSDNSKEGGKE